MNVKKILYTFYKNMNISPITFCARNKDIRKADDIMRKANQTFPMFSPSYATAQWETLSKDSLEGMSLRNSFIQKYTKLLEEKIRKNYNDDNDLYYQEMLKGIKEEKIGNCHEKSIATLSTLFANGYNKGARVNLAYEVSFINKKTNETITSTEVDMDHTCIITDMNNEERKKIDDLIVIDTWLQKTMTMQEARKTYLGKLKDSEKAFVIQNAKRRLLNNKEFKKQMLDINDCRMVEKINFYFGDKYTPEETKEFSELIISKYPETKFDIIA